jgi:hypothetical protein
MALVLADRVLETTTSTGSGTITLAGAEPGYQSFAVVGNTNQTYYTIAGDTQWEVGIGTYTSSGTTLSRDTVLSSSASGAKVTFSAGSKKVFVTYPSEKSVNFDLSGNITAASGRIINLGAPSLQSDAATKEYVDNMSSAALHIHEAVVLTTPADSGRNDNYNNGTAGVSATLTATANGTLVIDSTVAQSAQRVLIKDCTNQVQNGIYVVTTVGTASTPYVMTRASDADTSGEQTSTSLDEGSYFFTTGGTTQKGAAYVCTTPGVIVFGSTAITFAEFSQAQVYSAGNGISITLGSIALNTPVTVASGGTGLTTSPANGQLLIGNGSNYTLSTLTAGSGVSITNSAGSITLSATGLGGTVTAVTATGPLASSGGTTPDISIANSTGTGSVVLDQGATISSATITAAVSASITTITGTSANITTVTGTTAGFSSANITQLGTTSATITTLSGTNVTYSSGTVSQLAATSATIASVSGTNVTYSNGNLTSATITTVSGTTATYTSATVTNLALTSLTLANLNIASANITTLTGTNLTYTSGTVTNLNSTSANITTLTGTTFGTTATTQLRGASGQITTLSGTTLNYASATLGNLWSSTTISAGTTSTTGRINANEKGFTPSNTDVTKAAVVTSGSYGGGVVMNDGGIGAIWMQATGTEMGIGVGTTSGVAPAITVRNGGATIGSLTVTTLTGTSANITTLTGTTATYTNLTVSNTANASISGNAGTATLLQNARTINGTSFNGGANITITANTTNSVTFNNGGAGGASGSTFNGSGALTVSYNTVGACASRGTSWNDGTVINNSVGMLAWKNYGNGHVIFDASASTSPSGASVNNTNSQIAWTGSYPTLMGWNGSNTYGVRVDSARVSDSTTGNAATVTDGMYLSSTQTSSARKLFAGSQNVGTMLTATGSLGGLEAINPGGANAAFMSFHRQGAYASYFGIDTDNNFAVGGWSAGAGLAAMKIGTLGVGTPASGTGGEIRATNNVTAYYSDARLKDFKGKIGDALYKVSQLNGYYYTENEKAEEFGFKNKELQVGVSAQEVKAILPEVIAPAPFDMDAENKSKSGEDYMTVRYEKLVPLLIEAIKELKAEVEALKAAK